MNNAARLDMYKPRCQFFNDDLDEVCGLPAIAVYITGDSRMLARTICIDHRKGTLVGGDGPVFDLMLAREEKT